MARCDLAKTAAAKSLVIAANVAGPMEIDPRSLSSVRRFASAFHAGGGSLEGLVCNAAVYPPKAQARSPEVEEISVATDHLGHPADWGS